MRDKRPVMNARRHNCMYCLILNIIALKGTPEEANVRGDHIAAAKSHIVTPVGANDWHYAIKRFCSPNIDRMRTGGLSLILTTQPGEYSYNESGVFGNMLSFLWEGGW